MSVLSLIPALVFGGPRAVAEPRLAPRATIVLSRAAVSKEFVSAVAVSICTAAYPWVEQHIPVLQTWPPLLPQASIDPSAVDMLDPVVLLATATGIAVFAGS